MFVKPDRIVKARPVRQREEVMTEQRDLIEQLREKAEQIGKGTYEVRFALMLPEVQEYACLLMDAGQRLLEVDAWLEKEKEQWNNDLTKYPHDHEVGLTATTALEVLERVQQKLREGV